MATTTAKKTHKTCCCCGNDAGKWRQHWNRDAGYGICPACIEWLKSKGTSENEITDLYGKENVNWGKTA
jgi:hypothetical protein